MTRLVTIVRALRDGIHGRRPSQVWADLPGHTGDDEADRIAGALDHVRAQLWGRRWRRHFRGTEATRVRRLIDLEKRYGDQYAAQVAGTAAGKPTNTGWTHHPGGAEWTATDHPTHDRGDPR